MGGNREQALSSNEYGIGDGDKELVVAKPAARNDPEFEEEQPAESSSLTESLLSKILG
jgi:hypothetical protein